MNYPEDSLD